jgi:hypothetical protein
MTFARLTAWDSIATRRRRQSGPNFVTYSPSSAQHVRVRLELQAGACCSVARLVDAGGLRTVREWLKLYAYRQSQSYITKTARTDGRVHDRNR